MLVVTPDFPPEHGGIQTLVHSLVREFDTLDIRVVAIAHDGDRAFDRASGVDTVRAGSTRLPHRLNVALVNARAVQELRRFRPHVVLSAHIVCSPAAAVARRLGIPTAMYLHADELSASPRLAAFAVRRADRNIAVSEHTRGLALAAGAAPSTVEVIHNGTDLPDEVARRPADRPTMLTVAGMVKRYKGHDVVVRAMPLIRARVPDVQWVVVGSGPLDALYRDMVRDAGLEDCVRFRGFVDASERADWLDAAEVFVMPSRLRADGGGGEGFGIVYLEAGAHGMPVVGGAVGGAVDAIRDGETGVLVDPTDHVQVADAVADLLLDRERAERMGAAGRKWAMDHSWPHVARRVEDLLLSMAPVRSGAPRA